MGVASHSEHQNPHRGPPENSDSWEIAAIVITGEQPVHSRQHRLAGLLLAVWTFSVNPHPARAQEPDGESGISLEIDVFEADTVRERVCWNRPQRWPSKYRTRFLKASNKAAEATRPPHAKTELKPGATADEDCAYRLRQRLSPYQRGQPRVLSIEVVKAEAVIFTTEVKPIPISRLTSVALVDAWSQIWEAVAPEPPPPPPPPPPPEPEAFVDEDLVEAREELDQEPESKRRPRIVSLEFTAGFTGRSFESEAAGRDQEQDGLFSLGGRVMLHAGGFAGWTNQRLDFDFSYWRQLTSASVDGQEVGSDADRIRGTAVYGRQFFGRQAPEISVGLGIEWRRFTFDDAAETLSTEATVVRPGLGISQPLVRSSNIDLWLGGNGQVRVPLGSDYDVGADAQVYLRFSHASGFMTSLFGEYTYQSGAAGTVTFEENYFDVLLGAGWSL